MVSNNWLITNYESNRMIFKSTQFTDNNGNISDKLTWAFKGNKFFDNTAAVKQKTAHAELRQSLKRQYHEYRQYLHLNILSQFLLPHEVIIHNVQLH